MDLGFSGSSPQLLAPNALGTEVALHIMMGAHCRGGLLRSWWSENKEGYRNGPGLQYPA